MAIAKQQQAFVMHGARLAIEGGLAHIEEQVKALERAVDENPAFAFDLAKTVVESACKTVISERGGFFDKDDDIGKVFKSARHLVPFLPPAMAADQGARRSLEQTLGGLNAALQGICELRNAYGFASHGSDGPRNRLESIQALLAAQAADAIIGFLYRVHSTDLARPTLVRLEYDDKAEFNEWVDNENEPIRIFALPPYRPSEVLFVVDIEAYRDLLADYESEDKVFETGEGEATS